MKAIRIHQFGPTEEVLKYEDVPKPDPGPNELLIKVEAASLNRADLGLRKGTYRVSPEELPIIPGREFAGPVENVGANVTQFKVGQRVVAYTGKGGYAEYAVAKNSEVCPIPDGIDSATAAAVPTVFLTAWFGLLTDGSLKSGETLLVQAGSSGVGMAAVQIGKHLGAKVIATTSGEEKCHRVRDLGADVVIDYTKNDLTSEVKRATDQRGVDVVLDTVGGDMQQRSLRVLKPGGILVSVVSPVPEATQTRYGVRAAYFYVDVTTARLNTITELFESRKLVTDVGTVLSLEDARIAHEMLDGARDGALGNIKGKVVKDLFAIGPITRGTFWEITAVPDIRVACEKLAEHLLPHTPATAERQRARA